MDTQHLVSIASHLAEGQIGRRRGRPRQTDLCRAVSTAYYAMFHTLARCGADLLVGATRASRRDPAWEQTYRALEHRHARTQCRNSTALRRFPPEILDFAEHFVLMQRYRHYADYAPVANFRRSEIMLLVDRVADLINRFNRVPSQERRAFAVYVLFRARRD